MIYYVQVCKCKDLQCVSDSPFRGKCRTCNTFVRSQRVEQSDNAKAYINAIEAELENANFHSISSVPSRLFNSIKTLVPESLHFKLATAIASAMPQ